MAGISRIYQKCERNSTLESHCLAVGVSISSSNPWGIPNFNIGQLEDELYHIHQLIEEIGYFEVKQYRFILKAKAI